MRFATTAAILSLAAGIHAGVVPQEDALGSPQQTYGTLVVYTDWYCRNGAKTITVSTDHLSGLLDSGFHSVQAYLPTCQLSIWNTTGGFPALQIPHGNSNCHYIPGTALRWGASCH